MSSNKNNKILAVVISGLVLLVIVIGVYLYIQSVNATREANIKVQPTFTGPPEKSNPPASTNNPNY